MNRPYRIGVIGGDGIGPEVTAEAVKVLQVAARGIAFEFIDYPFGADHFLATGELISDRMFAQIRELDAVLLGAIGDPRVETGKLEFGIVGRLRFDLDLYVNLRPIKLLAPQFCPLKDKRAEDIDIVVVRENTEDAYRTKPRFEEKGTQDEVAAQEMLYTRRGTERIIRYAFELARVRPRAKLTLVDKANAIRAHDLYRRVFEEVGEEYPDVTRDVAFIDAACMWMVKNPESFDVVVTTNMFGDILTDLGAMVQGGLGVAAGGNIHPGRVSVFEPIHGSAPKHKGKKVANPIAAILAASMMLEHLGEHAAAVRVEQACQKTLQALPSLGTDSGIPTDEIGRRVVANL